ncbi:putative receptor protein kinase TMK1 [Platanthera guangdongensis]|uniref:Receptor protein kinase TMK1 n=1 Tax=Platanthera guangdongensis TaxID=2320717 RepID=A0ABR2MB77_9ASPA
MQSLAVLQLSYNMLSGEIPVSYGGLPLQILWLNEQKGGQISGSLDVVSSMTMLHEAWLHGNSLTGSIPGSIGQLTSLQRLWVNNNKLVGEIPASLTSLKQLQSLRLDNNLLVGPIPKNNIANFSYANNPTCQVVPGLLCAPEVTALLDFLQSVNWPINLAKSWSGNDPCNSWLGISCSSTTVSTINLPNFNLNGTISSSLAKLSNLVSVNLQGNHLNGTIPSELTSLQSLKLLNLSSNNLVPPVPNFSKSVKLFVDNNPQIQHPGAPGVPDTPVVPGTPVFPGSPQISPPGDSSGYVPFSPSHNGSSGSKKVKPLVVIVPIISALIILIVGLLICILWKKKQSYPSSIPVVVHPTDPSNCNLVKVSVLDTNSNYTTTNSDLQSSIGSRTSRSVMESGNLVISVQVLRSATMNFSAENELGRGGFGIVYKGKLEDGSVIAVKRMEFNLMSSQSFNEFHAEISVLSKVRHRNLVSLMGYAIEGNEKLLVYEYMSQGALSRHLFRWKELGLTPLSWKKRLNIALDVARAMEYLHSLAQNQGYIHRDLKSSNILLGDDFHAKVADFGLVKLAPDGNQSMATRVAGTFGYLAPEYAVTGKITTKADVFSFGVVLLELVTGLMVIDESRADEKQYLVSWFYNKKWDQEMIKDAVDNQIDASNEETFQSICKVVELLGHCTAREPSQRPEMGYSVSVLSSMVQKWKPGEHDPDETFGIELSQPLLQMVKGWQDADCQSSSSLNVNDSKESIPEKPAGFAEIFASQEGR